MDNFSYYNMNDNMIFEKFKNDWKDNTDNTLNENFYKDIKESNNLNIFSINNSNESFFMDNLKDIIVNNSRNYFFQKFRSKSSINEFDKIKNFSHIINELIIKNKNKINYEQLNRNRYLEFSLNNLYKIISIEYFSFNYKINFPENLNKDNIEEIILNNINYLEIIDNNLILQIKYKFDSYVNIITNFRSIDCNSLAAFKKIKKLKKNITKQKIKFNKKLYIIKKIKKSKKINNYYSILIMYQNLFNYYNQILICIKKNDYANIIKFYKKFNYVLNDENISENLKMIKIFKEKDLKSKLNLYFNNNFYDKCVDYFKISLIYEKNNSIKRWSENTNSRIYNKSFSINEDKLNISFIYEAESLSWSYKKYKRNIELEKLVSKMLVYFIELFDIEFKKYSIEILNSFKNFNEKLWEDLKEFSLKKNIYKILWSFKFLVEKNKDIIKGFLYFSRTLIFNLINNNEKMFEKSVININYISIIDFIENLYILIVDLINVFGKYVNEFILKFYQQKYDFNSYKNLSIVINEIIFSFNKELLLKLNPNYKNLKFNENHLENLKEFIKNCTKNINTNIFEKLKLSIESQFFNQMNLNFEEKIKTFLNIKNYIEINISYDEHKIIDYIINFKIKENDKILDFNEKDNNIKIEIKIDLIEINSKKYIISFPFIKLFNNLYENLKLLNFKIKNKNLENIQSILNNFLNLINYYIDNSTKLITDNLKKLEKEEDIIYEEDIINYKDNIKKLILNNRENELVLFILNNIYINFNNLEDIYIDCNLIIQIISKTKINIEKWKNFIFGEFDKLMNDYYNLLLNICEDIDKEIELPTNISHIIIKEINEIIKFSNKTMEIHFFKKIMNNLDGLIEKIFKDIYNFYNNNKNLDKINNLIKIEKDFVKQNLRNIENLNLN